MATPRSVQPHPAPASPPEAWVPLQRFARRATRPLERFLGVEAASGVLLLVAAAIALGWANSPWAASYRDLWHTPLGIRIGAFSFVAGVGFTMALFIAQLAFDDPRLLAAAKLGVLGASGAAAILGLALGRLLLSPVAVHGAAQTADDAERSTEM